MDFSCFIVIILSICKIRRCGCTKKNTQRWSVEGKSSNERRERANRCLWEQTSTWRFSSSVKSYGFLVWRSASATKISGSRWSRDGVAFTRIAIECLVRTRSDFRVRRLSRPFLHPYSRSSSFLISSVRLSYHLIDLPFLFPQSHHCFSDYPIFV